MLVLSLALLHLSTNTTLIKLVDEISDLSSEDITILFNDCLSNLDSPMDKENPLEYLIFTAVWDEWEIEWAVETGSSV